MSASSRITRFFDWQKLTARFIAVELFPSAELGDVTAVLPWWVVAGAWLAVPLLACTIGLVMIWLCARCNTARTTGMHWTEVARHRWAARAVLGGQVVIHLALVAFVTATCSGELTEPAAGARTIGAALLLWIASRGIFPPVSCCW